MKSQRHKHGFQENTVNLQWFNFLYKECCNNSSLGWMLLLIVSIFIGGIFKYKSFPVSKKFFNQFYKYFNNRLLLFKSWNSVISIPVINKWISCVPSYVITDSKFIMWRMIEYSVIPSCLTFVWLLAGNMNRHIYIFLLPLRSELL
jgi:hypothetical protein